MSSFSNMEAEGACKASEEGGPALAQLAFSELKWPLQPVCYYCPNRLFLLELIVIIK